MFLEHHQSDIEGGIDRAIQKVPRTKGFYANRVNMVYHSRLSKYLDPAYVTPTGKKLGRKGRERLVEAICLEDEAEFQRIINEGPDA